LRANQLLDDLARHVAELQAKRLPGPASDQIQATHVVFTVLIKVATHRSQDRVRCGPPLPLTAMRAQVDQLELGSIRDVGSRLHAFKACGLAVPTQGALTVSPAATAQEPTLPVLAALGPRATIMPSKERPKKIVLECGGGKQWTFLCKNESSGDLRKDSRLMEFNAVVNRLFSRDPQANRRKLRLRTYAVVCLSEECGLLEWVPDTMGFRAALNEVSGDVPGMRQGALVRQRLEEVQRDPALSAEERVGKFRAMVSEFPPRFHKWFVLRFPDPAAWFAARTLYTRSAAAWSMVGHVVGLGDRHAENILLDCRSGECVHVDFDCLFDKGLGLRTPELVPFRLTHNMVDALGLTGVEGPFRRSCEVSLGVLRANKDMLLSVLDSFVVDPLVEWSRKDKDGNPGTDKEASTQEERRSTGKSRLLCIEERLNGINRDREHVARALPSASGAALPPPAGAGGRDSSAVLFDVVPLSTQGCVQKLIDEALDEDKLSRMFGGWCPYL
jgi:serine/threonine-protein kinase ATR